MHANRICRQGLIGVVVKQLSRCKTLVKVFIDCVDCTGKFQCQSTALCVENSWLCDRENDCGDLSDEQNCSQSSFYWFHCFTVSRTSHTANRY